MPGLFRLSVLITLLFCFILSPAQAQDEPEAYQLISADNLNQLEVVAEFPCEGRNPAAAFHGDLFASTCLIGQTHFISIYSLSDSHELYRFQGGSNHQGLVFLSDDVLLGLKGDSFTIYRNQRQESISQEYHLNSSPTFSPDKSHIAFITGSPMIEQDSYDIFIYRLPDFELVEQSFSISSDVQNAKIALSNADTNLIAIGEDGGRIQIFNWETGELTLEIADSPFSARIVGEYASGDFPTRYAWLAFSADSSELFANQCTHLEMGCWDMGMTRFDAATGEVLASAEHPNNGEFFFAGLLSEARLLLHSTGCDALYFYDMDSLSQLEYSFQVENCGGESYYAANEAGTLIAVYDDPTSKFLFYGIPSD
jgi:hypothetical protein